MEENKELNFTEKDLNIMREFLSHEDQYLLISLKGRVATKLKGKGKSYEEILCIYAEMITEPARVQIRKLQEMLEEK